MYLPKLIVYVDGRTLKFPDDLRKLDRDEFDREYVAVEGDIPTDVTTIPDWLFDAATSFTYIIPVPQNHYALGLETGEANEKDGITSIERTGHAIIVRGTEAETVLGVAREDLKLLGQWFRDRR